MLKTLTWQAPASRTSNRVIDFYRKEARFRRCDIAAEENETEVCLSFSYLQGVGVMRGTCDRGQADPALGFPASRF